LSNAFILALVPVYSEQVLLSMDASKVTQDKRAQPWKEWAEEELAARQKIDEAKKADKTNALDVLGPAYIKKDPNFDDIANESDSQNKAG